MRLNQRQGSRNRSLIIADPELRETRMLKLDRIFSMNTIPEKEEIRIHLIEHMT
jgi:hypothetical protein